MNRIQKLFANAKINNKKIFTAFLTMGYPTIELSEKAVATLIENGTDIIEFGVPFSDPMADGPVIREAANKALENGANLKDILASVKRLRAKFPETPFVLFSYYNVIFSKGLESFAKMAKDSGLDAVLVVDIVLEDREELLAPLRAEGLTLVPLVAPTTPIERVKEIAEGLEDSFLYAITINGVTGTRNELPKGLEIRLNDIREHSQIPVLAGFGVSKPEHAKMICRASDGFIIGSAIEKIILNNPTESVLEEIADFAKMFTER